MNRFTMKTRALATLFLAFAVLSFADGVRAADYPIHTLDDLQNMRNHLEDRCILMNDIDATDTRNWNDGKGFEPVGLLSGPEAPAAEYFRGSFEGNGHTIRNLYINRPETDFVGLFAGVLVTGTPVSIANISLENADITGGSRTAPLVSRFHSLSESVLATGLVSNCSATGNVRSVNNISGGLVAVVLGTRITISDCRSSCRVSGINNIGGIVGGLDGQSFISRCYASGSLSGSGDNCGGVVGSVSNSGRVLDCSSTAAVKGVNIVGGVIGSLAGASLAERCSNLRDVAGEGSNVGGLAGFLGTGALIRNSFSVGNVAGGANTGGFAGQNNGGSISYSYCRGRVTGAGGNFLGLFVNPQNTPSLLQYNYWDVTLSESMAGHTDNQMEAITATQMVQPSSFETWDFNNVWAMEQSDGHKTAPFFRFRGGSGSLEDPYRIGDVYGLQGMGLSESLRACHFIQIRDIDASITRNWNNGIGFIPIGAGSGPFNGRFDGKGFSIGHLYINLPLSEGPVGFFSHTGSTSVITDVHLETMKVVGGSQAGGLVGRSLGTVSGCSVVGKVYGGGFAFTGAFILIVNEQMLNLQSFTGGLVGFQEGGRVENCYANTEIKGLTNSGGLIGTATAAVITNCRSRGLVYGNTLVGGFLGMSMESLLERCESRAAVHGNTATGGLVGYIFGGKAYRCVATGKVAGYSMVGGLMGMLQGEVAESWCSGSVQGSFDTGGFAGIVQGLTRDSFATGAVSGGTNTGGFAGYTMPGGVMTRCYSKGTVTGGAESGGFVGFNSVEEQDLVSCIWRMSGAVVPLAKAGTGLDGNQMVLQSSYSEWDFVTTWVMTENVLPPFLTWDSEGADLSVTVLSDGENLSENDPLLFTIRVANQGPNDAFGIVLSFDHGLDLKPVEYSLDQGKTWNPWETPLLLGDLSVNVTLNLLVRGSVISTENREAYFRASAEFEGHEFDQADNTGSKTWTKGEDVKAGDGSGCFISSVSRG